MKTAWQQSSQKMVKSLASFSGRAKSLYEENAMNTRLKFALLASVFALAHAQTAVAQTFEDGKQAYIRGDFEQAFAKIEAGDSVLA